MTLGCISSQYTHEWLNENPTLPTYLLSGETTAKGMAEILNLKDFGEIQKLSSRMQFG